ncbi:MAG: DUF192 domain-containing protein [Candidatus Aenigmatarchaeota archaeon]|nr:MAG: DUF192 domain-containing protein [Candidatus Aenigmarchaeota archaeon]
MLSELEIADTSWKRIKGLMLRESPGKGMLFIFDKPCKPGMWMFLMRFPIDMVFLDSDFIVTDMFECVKPMGFDPRTWKIYKPSKPVKYVLELPCGMIKREGIHTGKRIDIAHSLPSSFKAFM